MADLTLTQSLDGFPDPPNSNPALAALLLESLCSIDVECQAMQHASLHYSITKHVHAIRESVAQMLAEIADRPLA